MPETVRRLKVNRRYEGMACRWCGDALLIGQDGAICEACESPHHAGCWDRHNGCNGESCVNRPLQQLPPEVAPKETKPLRELRPGENVCPSCGDIVSGFCFRCSQAPEGEYTGEKLTAPEAKAALKYAIIGLFCFGIILGPIAISKGAAAKRQIATDPTLGGEGIATAAQVIGGIEIVLFILGIFGRLAA